MPHVRRLLGVLLILTACASPELRERCRFLSDPVPGEELSSAPDFFVPLHVEHLVEWCPEVIPFLGLPPGWRFLLADGYEDVWEDASLLKPDREQGVE